MYLWGGGRCSGPQSVDACLRVYGSAGVMVCMLCLCVCVRVWVVLLGMKGVLLRRYILYVRVRVCLCVFHMSVCVCVMDVLWVSVPVCSNMYHPPQALRMRGECLGLSISSSFVQVAPAPRGVPRAVPYHNRGACARGLHCCVSGFSPVCCFRGDGAVEGVRPQQPPHTATPWGQPHRRHRPPGPRCAPLTPPPTTPTTSRLPTTNRPAPIKTPYNYTVLKKFNMLTIRADGLGCII